MKFLLISFYAIVLLGTANAQTFSMGHCNISMDTQKNLDIFKFVGNWYVHQRSFSIDEEDKTCSYFPYTLSSSDDCLYVVNHTFIDEKKDYTWDSVHYTVDAIDLNVGKLKFSPGHISKEQPLWVLATDYNDYWIAYSCYDAFQGKLEYAWILSKSPKRDQSIIEYGEKLLIDKGIDIALIAIDQKNCQQNV